VALRVSKGLNRTVLTASLLGVGIAVTGMVIAYYADIAPGGSVVLTGVGLLVMVETAALVKGRAMRRRGFVPPDHSHDHLTHAHGLEPAVRVTPESD
jgi:zinc transport system permease protein